MELRPREPVILAEDFERLVSWYCEILGFVVLRRFDDAFHYATLQSSGGIRVAVAAAGEMGVTPSERSGATVVLQFETDDVKALFEHVSGHGGRITSGPSFDTGAEFWFGSFADPEGNSCWVVDANCPQ